MRRGRTWGAQVLMLALVLVGLGFGYSFAREVVQAQRLANQGEVSRQANDALAAGNRKLARDLQYYQSDAYAELRARTDLNMRLPNEQIVLPVLTDTLPPAAPSGVGGTQSGAAPGTGIGQSAAPDPARTGGRAWDRWAALFGTGR
ncbi:MAG: septum formation initiator family protein [Chloroflexota bacterium]|nr:septum formation initiator family protein [Chloroflexota bacterium]